MAITPVAPSPSDEVLAQLADLARVPNETREYFYSWIRIILLGVGPSRATPPPISVSLSRAAKALRVAREALANLDESERQRVLSRRSEFTFWGDSELEFQIELLLFCTEGRLDPIRRRAKYRGRHPGAVENRRLRELIHELFWTAEISEGQFTVDKHSGDGTILKALDVIAPYVIAEILPKKLPLSISTIQRIKKEVAQRLQEYLPTERHRRHWRLRNA